VPKEKKARRSMPSSVYSVPGEFNMDNLNHWAEGADLPNVGIKTFPSDAIKPKTAIVVASNGSVSNMVTRKKNTSNLAFITDIGNMLCVMSDRLMESRHLLMNAHVYIFINPNDYSLLQEHFAHKLEKREYVTPESYAPSDPS
jgi:hypothetical protein